MRNNGRNAMRAVKLNKKELLTILTDNKTKHVNDFKEAIDDYKKAVLKIANDNLKIAQAADVDKFEDFTSFPRQPISYEKSYIRAIRMLELSVDNEIELEEDVFNQLVLDEWDWKHSFSVTNASYKSMI